MFRPVRQVVAPEAKSVVSESILFNSAVCLCTKCRAIETVRYMYSLRAVLLLQGRSFIDELSPQNILSQNRAPCEDDFETIKLISNGAYGYI